MMLRIVTYYSVFCTMMFTSCNMAPDYIMNWVNDPYTNGWWLVLFGKNLYSNVLGFLYPIETLSGFFILAWASICLAFIAYFTDDYSYE